MSIQHASCSQNLGIAVQTQQLYYTHFTLLLFPGYLAVLAWSFSSTEQSQQAVTDFWRWLCLRSRNQPHAQWPQILLCWHQCLLRWQH